MRPSTTAVILLIPTLFAFSAKGQSLLSNERMAVLRTNGLICQAIPPKYTPEVDKKFCKGFLQGMLFQQDMSRRAGNLLFEAYGSGGQRAVNNQGQAGMQNGNEIPGNPQIPSLISRAPRVPNYGYETNRALGPEFFPLSSRPYEMAPATN